MTLATATGDGVAVGPDRPAQGFDERGFVFFTDYRSRKGAELEANPRAALVFYWASWIGRCGSRAASPSPRRRSRSATSRAGRSAAGSAPGRRTRAR